MVTRATAACFLVRSCALDTLIENPGASSGDQIQGLQLSRRSLYEPNDIVVVLLQGTPKIMFS